MVRRLAAGAALAGLVYLVIRSLPDLQRYMRIRNM